jgi:leucyl aminopeptidase (aminopeptidase T)
MTDDALSDLAQAATALVARSLGVESGANFVVICDAESAGVALAVGRAAEAIGANVTTARLDHLRSAATNETGERPHKVLPDALRREMQIAHASAFVASAPQKERSMREELFHLVEVRGVCHAHMPDITPRAFTQTFALGYDRVAVWGEGIRRRLEFARRLHTKSPAGTALEVTLADPCRWIPRLGEVAPGACVAFPAGAIFGVPERLDGIFVANASVGEFFGARHGLLLRTPLRLVIDDSRVVSVEAPLARDLVRDVRSMLQFAENSDRIGLIAVGVNMGIEAPTGWSAMDENLPGLHLVVGDPASHYSGVSWSARTTFAACQAGAQVTVDGSVVIDAGKIVSVL